MEHVSIRREILDRLVKKATFEGDDEDPFIYEKECEELHFEMVVTFTASPMSVTHEDEYDLEATGVYYPNCDSDRFEPYPGKVKIAGNVVSGLDRKPNIDDDLFIYWERMQEKADELYKLGEYWDLPTDVKSKVVLPKKSILLPLLRSANKKFDFQDPWVRKAEEWTPLKELEQSQTQPPKPLVEGNVKAQVESVIKSILDLGDSEVEARSIATRYGIDIDPLLTPEVAATAEPVAETPTEEGV